MLRAGNPTRAVVGALIAALCAGALLTIALIVFGPEISETNGKIAQTVLVLALTSMTGVSGSNLARQRSVHAVFGYLTMVVALVAFALVTFSIWSDDAVDNRKAIAYALVLAFATGHASYLLRAALDDNRAIRWVRAGTILPLAVLVVMVFIDLAADRGVVGTNPISVTVVLYILGVVLVPLLRRYDAAN